MRPHLNMNCLSFCNFTIVFMTSSYFLENALVKRKIMILHFLVCKHLQGNIFVEKNAFWGPKIIIKFFGFWFCGQVLMSMQCNWKMTKHLWKIKNPILRAARLKIYYVDIFSNERCFKFVLDSTGDCKICGSVVSKSLQLLDCSNARRMWKICE